MIVSRIPKGAPNKDLAMKFLAEISQGRISGQPAQIHHLRPDQQGRF